MAFEKVGICLEVLGDAVFSESGAGNLQVLQRAHI
jgi:hypothetical protein